MVKKQLMVKLVKGEVSFRNVELTTADNQWFDQEVKLGHIGINSKSECCWEFKNVVFEDDSGAELVKEVNKMLDLLNRSSVNVEGIWFVGQTKEGTFVGVRY